MRPSPAELPEVLRRYSEAVAAELDSAVPQDDVELYRALRYHLGWIDENGFPSPGSEGKGLRPALCLLACEAVGGTSHEALPAAAAVELVHNFSLIHDDIQDQDRQRHHRPTIWALWGVPQALNDGNALYALANTTLLKLARNKAEPDRIVEASARLARSSLEMMQGQYLDIEFENRLDVTTQEYLEMSARKTGALIACAMELGALVGSGEPGLVSAFAQYGRDIGRLFQIRDDILGVWGDEAATGKVTGGDIRRKKKTFPIIYALQHSTGLEGARLRGVLQEASVSEDNVKQVLSVLESTGAREEAEALAQQLSRRALDALRPAELRPGYAQAFEEVATFLLLREG